MEKKRISIISLIITILCAVLCAGTHFLFHACGAKEDGGYMLCHWAEVSVKATALVMCLQGIIMTAFRQKKVQAALSLAMIPEAILCMLYPNIIIPMCMMTDMRCHAVMRPCVILISAVMIILLIINVIISIKGKEHVKD